MSGPGPAVGRLLDHCLQGPASSWAGRAVRFVDEWFNLGYLAERLQHEPRAIREYVGNVRRLPAGSASLISIVTPLYGIGSGYVRAFVRSIQRQSYGNWELCLCLDGEPDKRVQRFVRRLNRVDPDRYRLAVHERNEGISAATESALGLAKGGILAFADGDDLLHRDALAAVAKAFSSDPGIELVYTNNDILTPWGYRLDPLYKPAWSPELLLSCNYLMHLVAARRELLNRCPGLWRPEVNGVQDWDMVLRATSAARRVHHIPIVLYHWRAHGGSTAVSAAPKAWADEAAANLRERFVQDLDERLCWEEAGDGEPAVLRFREGRAPALHVIELHDPADSVDAAGAPDRSRYAYPGPVERNSIRLADGVEALADTLDNWMETLPVEDALVLVVRKGLERAALAGNLDAQAAYAVLPGVACVWPFFNEWKGTYTVSGDALVARASRTSFYTPLSGNVLTGPLHNVMFSLATWKRLGGFRACGAGDLPGPQPVDVLGALLGLRALGQGLRNVAVRAVRCHWTPPVLDLGPLAPALDPYP